MVNFVANIVKVTVHLGSDMPLGTTNVVVIVGACCFVYYQQFAAVSLVDALSISMTQFRAAVAGSVRKIS